jgi:hypothetical protein
MIYCKMKDHDLLKVNDDQWLGFIVRWIIMIYCEMKDHDLLWKDWDSLWDEWSRFIEDE